MNIRHGRLAKIFVLAIALLIVSVGTVTAQGRQPLTFPGIGPVATYEVTIENLTDGQPFTPALIATHRRGISMFRVGEPATFELKEIAENGNLAPMKESLNDNVRTYEVVQAPTPQVPGGLPGSGMFDDSVTLTISADLGARFLSYSAMLICTNDGFTGVDSLVLPFFVGDSVTVYGDGYDAGTEINTEDFADIVPPCQGLVGVTSDDAGTGMSNPALAENEVIRHHPGIMGGEDLVPEVHGWDDPVVKITVTRIE